MKVFLSPFRDAPEYLSLNGNKRKKFSPHSMINAQEEADCGACSLVRFFFAKEMNDVPIPLTFLFFHEAFGHSSKRKTWCNQSETAIFS